MNVPNTIFIDETTEILAQLEQDVVSLEQSPHDADLLNRMFRGIHTIKGSGGMFGFDYLSEQAHVMENVFDRLRDRELQVTRQIIDLTLQGIDQLKLMLQDPDEHPRTAGWDQLAEGTTGAATSDAPPATPDSTEATFGVYHIYFRPDPQLMMHGARPLLLIQELEELGEVRVTADDAAIPDFESLDPEQCLCSFDILLAGEIPEQDIRDVFMFVEHGAELRIRRIAISQDDPQELPRLGEILQQRTGISDEQMQRILDEQQRYLKLGELAVAKGYVRKEDVDGALQEQRFVREQAARHSQASSSLRIPGAKVDAAVNLVGELVTMQARLSRRAHELQDPLMGSIVEGLELLVADLRQGVMSMRLVPLQDTFLGFRRLVRDLANDTGKALNLELSGGETEMDKLVIDRLKGPLVHLIRNCADHGIEGAEQRAGAGKPVEGTIRIAARYIGSQVEIEIADDGGGVDLERVRRKAVERGILAEGEVLEPGDVLAILAAPGFSTSEQVSSVSGRGVGMDAVQMEVEALSGQLSMDSTEGQGTVFRIRLPLTLAIIDSLLVRVGQEFFYHPSERC